MKISVLLLFLCIISVVESHDSRISKIHNLLDVYKQQHSMIKIKQESPSELCSRNFSVDQMYYLGCHLIGNSFGSFYNGLLSAVVFNRTIVLRKPVNCDGVLSLHNWISTWEQLSPLLRKANCPLRLDRNDVGWAINDNNLERLKSVLNERIINYDELFNQAYDFFQPQNEALQPLEKERAKILFSSPFDIDHGRFEPFGFLMPFSFSMSPQLVDLVHSSIRNYSAVEGSLSIKEEYFMIGVHIRHESLETLKDGSLEAHLDQQYLDAITLVLQKESSRMINKKCLIAIASDRPTSIERVSSFASSIQCTAVCINRDMNAAFRNSKPMLLENGPWIDSLHVLADISLLSLSNYFVGSKQSTFSYLIANNVALRFSSTADAAEHGPGPMWWVSHAPSSITNVNRIRQEMFFSKGI